ncbi:unnamed protein product [Effrenium voratum]|nr:unnamed protein product [Effrenium voratum]
MSFRYTVKPRMKVNAFKPKELTAEEKGAGELRASQFGALWCNKFASIPKNKDCGIIWEVKVGEEVPATVAPTKPKFCLLCKAVLKVASAIKIT